MPLYEYVCQDCDRKTEVIQQVGARPLKICPHCGGKLKKAVSAPAIHFKGSGFYTTDYARGTNSGKSGASPRSESEAKPSESGAAGSKKEKSGETKTEPKKEAKKN